MNGKQYRLIYVDGYSLDRQVYGVFNSEAEAEEAIAAAEIEFRVADSCFGQFTKFEIELVQERIKR